MPADFLLEDTIDGTCVPHRRFHHALDLKQNDILVALVGDCLRPPNGQQWRGQKCGTGASRKTNEGEATRMADMPRAGMSYDGLDVVFEGDLAVGLAAVVQGDGLIDVDRSTGAESWPDLNCLDIPQGQTNT